MSQLNPVIPSVNPNARGFTDPLENPYPNVTPNPITNPNVVTPGLTPAPSVTPNSSTLPNQGIIAGQAGTMPDNTGTRILGGVAPSGGAGTPSGAGGRDIDRIID